MSYLFAAMGGAALVLWYRPRSPFRVLVIGCLGGLFCWSLTRIFA